MLTCTWWTCSMEKSLLKQALSMGMDEAWTIRLLPGEEPPPWRALSRESSVPLEAWLTESKCYSMMLIQKPKQIPTENHVSSTYGRSLKSSMSCCVWCCVVYLWTSLRWGPAGWSRPAELPSFWASVQPAARGPLLAGHPVLWNMRHKFKGENNWKKTLVLRKKCHVDTGPMQITVVYG